MELLFAASLLVGAASVAQADPVTFTLVQPDLFGAQGSTLTWQYDVVNNSGGTIYGLDVNSDIWQSGMPDATAFDFFGGGIGIANGSSLIGPLYAFNADPAIANSLNSGTFDLQILLPDTSVTDLYAAYSATIGSGVPEPSFLGLAAFGAAACLIRGRRGGSTL